jgi:hypothetical protein
MTAVLPNFPKNGSPSLDHRYMTITTGFTAAVWFCVLWSPSSSGGISLRFHGKVFLMHGFLD